MVKKILLVTLYDDNNIGNRLQNYALQKKVMDYGIEVTTLNNYYTTAPNSIDKVKILIKKVIGTLGNSKYKDDYEKYLAQKKIRNCNKKFDRNNLMRVLKIKNKDAFNYDWSKYDLAITGSDQVWHKWRNDVFELPYYYLQFISKEKRTAYAASFGWVKLPEKDISQHRQGLLEMKNISCREKIGCDLVEECTGKIVPRVLDPTLLLSVSDWNEIEKQACSIDVIENKKRYSFVYLLGEITSEYISFMKKVMKENHIDTIIDFRKETSLKIMNNGPAEFIKLIDNAEYVFTDSFHCTVFSVLFDKKFTVFRRQQVGFEKMFGRIEDLLASKGALEHIYGGTDKSETNDFEKLYEDSIEYLEDVLEINA